MKINLNLAKDLIKQVELDIFDRAPFIYIKSCYTLNDSFTSLKKGAAKNMLSSRQKDILSILLKSLSIKLRADDPSLNIIQVPGYIDSPIEVDSIATATMACLGLLVNEVSKVRGIGNQELTIDTRHASLMLNSIAYHFQNGWQFDIGPVHSPINNFYETKDNRWIFYNGAYQHLRDGLLHLLSSPNEHGFIAKKTKQYNAYELESLVAKNGLCAAVARTQEEWKSTDVGKILANQPVIELIKISDSPKKEMSNYCIRPLDGLKVLEFVRVIAGPTIGRQLAEQGADVIHCRHPYFDHIVAFELETSYGKKNCFLDYSRKQDMDVLQDLLKDADVFLGGYRTDALARFGLGPNDLIEKNNHLIYVEFNCYGFNNDWTGRRGWEQLAQSASGLAYEHAHKNMQNLSLVPAYLNDYLTGYLGAIGAIAARLKQHQEGGAWLVRVSLTRTAMFAAGFTSGNGETFEITHKDLEKYCIDQPSSVGLLTRVSPPIIFSKTPSMTYRPATYPGTDTLNIGWGSEPIYLGSSPHSPTEIFKHKKVHFKGQQSL
jgi:CoA-transferase family III